jgi:uncharacterized protein (TIGR00255 family)
MTGFGRAAGRVGGAEAEIWARSVNHRSFDLTVRVKETEATLEPVLRRVFSRRLGRGKVDVTFRLKRAGTAGYEVSLNEELLRSVLARFASVSEKLSLAGQLHARDLLAIPQIFSVDNAVAEFSTEEISAVEALAEDAATALVAMREQEGQGIARDIGTRLILLRAKSAELSARRDEIRRTLHANLRQRIAELWADVPIDPARVEQEAALAADRSDVAEELQRLEGHLDQFSGLISSAGEPVGKKLEFLSQEILRELNTLGSKARDLRLVRDVLDMKSETEKIREQIGNVE